MPDLIATLGPELKDLRDLHRKAKHPGPPITRRTSCLECLLILDESDPRLHAIANVLRTIDAQDATRAPQSSARARRRAG